MKELPTKPVLRNATVVILDDDGDKVETGGQCLLAVSPDGCFFSAPSLPKIMVRTLDQFNEYLTTKGTELPTTTLDILRRALSEARARAS